MITVKRKIRPKENFQILGLEWVIAIGMVLE